MALAGWNPLNRFKIEVDNSVIDSDLDWFPLVSKINSSAGKTSTDLTPVFDEVGANYLKIAITKDDDTELFVEIEKWDDTGEEAVLWISRSTLTVLAASTTTLYLYYDNTHADNTAFVATQGSRTEVYNTNTKCSYHLSEASGNRTDSTSNNNDLTEEDGTVDGVVGKIGQGADFELADTESLRILDASQTGLDITGNISFRCWAKLESQPSSSLYSFGAKWGSSGNRGYQFSYYNDGVDYQFVVDLSSDGTTREFIEIGTQGTPILANGTWYHLLFTYNSTSDETKVYLNGTQFGITNTGALGGLNNNSMPFRLGASDLGAPTTGSPAYYLDGVLDQAALFSEELSAAWAKADYNSGNDSLITYTFDPATESDINLLDCKVVIKSSATSLLDGLVVIGEPTEDANLLDGKVVIKSSVAELLDGLVVISEGEEIDLLDGKVEILGTDERDYSRENTQILSADDSDLATVFTTAEEDIVSIDNGTFVTLTGSTGFLEGKFKQKGFATNTKVVECNIAARFTIAPSSANVLLQVYNQNSSAWETIETESTAGSNEKFTMKGVVNTNLSDYYASDGGGGYYAAFRTYQ